MKATCKGWIILPRTILSLKVITFEIILYIVKHKLVGLKWFEFVVLSILGNRAKKVWLLDAQ